MAREAWRTIRGLGFYPHSPSFFADVIFDDINSMLPSTQSVPSDALVLSTVESCSLTASCEHCLRIDISLNATGLPQLNGFGIQILEVKYNAFHSFKITRKKTRKEFRKNLWKAQIDCCNVEVGQFIDVTLFTDPNYSLSINKRHFVPDPDGMPDFNHTHIPGNREIEVFLSPGPDAIASLMYKIESGECDFVSLNRNGVPKKIDASQKLILKYEVLLPCLCIEVYYNVTDAERNTACPFYRNSIAYTEEFWDISMIDISNHTSMHMAFNKKCDLEPSVTLCEKKNDRCTTVPNATIQTNQSSLACITEYSIPSIDRDPHLCFKFNVSNVTHERCPEAKDRVWNVTVDVQSFRVLLTIFTRLPSSYSAVICKPNISTGRCYPESSVYDITVEQNTDGELRYLTVPKPNIGSCIQVWRSDVNFSYKHIFCPDFSQKHLGLVFLGMSVAVFMLVLLVFLTIQRIWKKITAPLWRTTVLLVYSPDSAEYKTLICAFADFLQSILGCEVILDLWDMNTVSQIGMLPWFYQKRDLVSERKGNVLLIWTKKSRLMFDQWKSSTFGTLGWRDPNNLFGAAMSCLQKDLEVEDDKEVLKNYSVVYFEGLCEKRDIPVNLRKFSRYRLLKDLYRLVIKLQGTTCLPPPCLIKAAAKYLMRKLKSSEKSTGLQRHLDHCRQNLNDGFG
ncbi:interleukin-17 receptor E [Spea bombifrons]|uniref:interleukin-17 receptor E n=1 Tax=Spea bombifrons TaxID=233779 RepID=UPI0023494A96|nr:interleukin-17 receptor E [Spea bombifrons]